MDCPEGSGHLAETAGSRGVELYGPHLYCLTWSAEGGYARVGPADRAGYKVAPSTAWQFLKDACTWPGSPPTPPVNG